MHRPIQALHEVPHFDLTGRDGLPCRVWKNLDLRDATGLRGLLTRSDLYVWQSINLLHPDFERETGIEGMRIALRVGQIQVNDETAALPEHFPWVFPDLAQAEAMDVEDRRKIVTEHLQKDARLKRAYPAGFTVIWYI